MADQMQGEAQELQQLQQIAQLAQSGDPNALPQISQIVAGMIQAQETEMKQMQGDANEQATPSFKDRLRAKLAAKEQQPQE